MSLYAKAVSWPAGTALDGTPPQALPISCPFGLDHLLSDGRAEPEAKRRAATA